MSLSDRAFRTGGEPYGLKSNTGCFTLRGQTMGLLGFGALGEALLPLLNPFEGRLLVHDPWIPPAALADPGMEPVDLEPLFETSKVVFVLAGATSENQGFINADMLARMADGSAFVLVSRPNVVDFDALTAEAASGRLRVASDVFPTEPFAADHPLRKVDGAVMSAHRAGALDEVFLEMGRYLIDDIALMNRGLPPRRCKRADIETVSRMRSRPVDKS